MYFVLYFTVDLFFIIIIIYFFTEYNLLNGTLQICFQHIMSLYAIHVMNKGILGFWNVVFIVREKLDSVVNVNNAFFSMELQRIMKYVVYSKLWKPGTHLKII